MLPAAHRMRRRTDFTATVREGRRSGGERVVVHILTPSTPSTDPVLVGFVVSKAVGPSVTRKLVTRRLRHLMAERLERCPAGSRVVVRALPASREATYADLGAALDRGIDRCLRGTRSAS